MPQIWKTSFSITYEILDTPASAEFDDFTRLASEICGTPIALISLLDEDRQWFKSKVGLDAAQTPRDISFCGHAIHGTDLFEIPNALEDERFKDNPLVTGAPDIRFYAGEPLITSDGFGIGTLCVIDRIPHQLNASQRDALKVLGRLLVLQLEMRVSLRREQELNVELAAQANFRKSLLNSAGMAMIAADRSGLITSFNFGAERLSGYSPGEVLGKMKFGDFVQGEPVDCGNEPSETHEGIFLRKDQATVPVELTMSVIADADNINSGLLAIVADISERKLLENTKAEFISVVSHELRTPLTSIRASLGLLEAGVLGLIPAKALEVITIANRNSQRLITLVNDILDMDKLMSGKMTIHTDKLNLVSLIEQSIEANKGYAETYQVQYAFLDRADRPEVIGDEDRLMQVMANLLSNAAKFSTTGTQIDIRLVSTGTALRVEVQDHGEGIPLEFQPKIFGKFAQASNSSTRNRGGTGLGLHICQKLMEKMNGQIGFDTVIGKGSTFWFSMPLA